MPRRQLIDPDDDAMLGQEDRPLQEVNGYHLDALERAWLLGLDDPPEYTNPSGHRKNIRGRYQPQFARQVYHLRLLGASKREIALFFDVDEKTIHEWYKGANAHPAFAYAWQKGGEAADARVATALYHRAIGYSHPEEKIFCGKGGDVTRVETNKHYPPDVGAAMAWLTNRQRDKWKNRVQQALTGDDDQPLLPPQLSVLPVKVVYRRED